MKNIIIALFAVCLTACNPKTNTLPAAYESDSWRCYAQKYCKDGNNPTEDEVNGYLDWYVGSVEEEKDLGVDQDIVFSSDNIKELVENSAGYWVVYDDPQQNLDCELLQIDYETYDRLQVCLTTKYGKMNGRLVLNQSGEYMYNHEIH